MRNFFEAHRENHGGKAVIVSTDIVGIFGSPEHSLHFWRDVLPSSLDVSLEIILWQHLLSSYNHNPENIQKLPVSGYHGRLGEDRTGVSELADRFKVLVANTLLAPTDKILNHAVQERQQIINNHSEKPERTALHATRNPQYVLVHEPEARTQQTDILHHHYKQKYPDHSPYIAVENHTSEGSLQRARELVKMFILSGAPAFLVFDVVHALREQKTPLTISNRWEYMIAELKKSEQTLVHVPIGTNLNDSIDFGTISQPMLKKLGEVIQENESLVVLEHQSPGFTNIFRANPSQKPSFRYHARKSVQKLRTAGIIDL